MRTRAGTADPRGGAGRATAQDRHAAGDKRHFLCRAPATPGVICPATTFGRARWSPTYSATASVPSRWMVERGLSWFGRNRRLAKDFENLDEILVTFVTVASIQLVLRRKRKIRPLVLAGRDPAIHGLLARASPACVDARHKAGHGRTIKVPWVHHLFEPQH